VNYTASELLAVMAARQLAGVSTVFAGVGLPLLSAVLAQRTVAPGLIIVVEGGAIGFQVIPGRLPISTNEMRGAYRAQMLPGITDTFLFAQRGFFDMGFVGGAQIDRFGNLNSSVVGSYEAPKVRLPGSGGANDIISLCRRVIVATMHERRRFVPRVDFLTSPGFIDGRRSRTLSGLVFGRVSRVVTNLGIMEFEEESKLMRIESLHPDVSLSEVIDSTGFELLIPKDIGVTESPTPAELGLLRALDPDRNYLRDDRGAERAPQGK
jgi:glutaconate CoA-transferase, subunit B